MFDYLVATGQARGHSLASRGLTPNDSRALFSLDDEQGRPMGTLANQWGCDPSNATFIVDRLEKAGLVERRAAEGDRRVKLVALTKLGARTKQELLAEFHVPPREFAALRVADLETLENILRMLWVARGRDAPEEQASRSPQPTRARS